jgi:hypothetical protein
VTSTDTVQYNYVDRQARERGQLPGGAGHGSRPPEDQGLSAGLQDHARLPPGWVGGGEGRNCMAQGGMYMSNLLKLEWPHM